MLLVFHCCGYLGNSQVSVDRTIGPTLVLFYHDDSLLWLYLGNSQVSVDRTIGPSLVLFYHDDLLTI